MVGQNSKMQQHLQKPWSNWASPCMIPNKCRGAKHSFNICSHYQRWKPHGSETLKLAKRRQLCPHSYKWSAFSTPVASWATASKTGLAVLHVCNLVLLQKISISSIWKAKPKAQQLPECKWWNHLPKMHLFIAWFCQPLVGGEQEYKQAPKYQTQPRFQKTHHKMQANQLGQEIHTDQVLQWARKWMIAGFQQFACLHKFSEPNEVMAYIKSFSVRGTQD